MLKQFFYLLFSMLFHLFKLFPLNSNRVTFVMTHDKDLNGNIGAVYKYLEQNYSGLQFHFITREHYKLNKLKNIWIGFLKNSFYLATSSYVFLDNVFLPSAYFTYKKRVKVVQLWHGCGAIKKFGQDVNIGKLAKLEKRANSRYTHLISNCSNMERIYRSAFNVKKSIIHTVGLPRTDFFFNHHLMAEKKRMFFQHYPQLRNKKLILYAPTFRDNEINEPKLAVDFALLQANLSDEYVFLVRLHPHIRDRLKLQEDRKFIYDMSKYEDLNTLLLVADILITDYSSIIFEYAILEKPIIFFAYDLKEYAEHIRGFYYDYESYVPGPIVKDTLELMNTIRSNQFDMERIRRFSKENHEFTDGKSTERVVRLIFHEEKSTQHAYT